MRTNRRAHVCVCVCEVVCVVDAGAIVHRSVSGAADAGKDEECLMSEAIQALGGSQSQALSLASERTVK